MSDQGLRVGAQRSQQHLLHMVLSKAQQESGSDVSRNLIRTASPHLDADIAGLQGPDVLLSSTPTSGRGGLDTEYPGGMEDRKHMPDRSHWSLIGGNSAVGSPAALSGDSMLSWGRSGVEGIPAALLGQQASFEEHTRDTEIDAPMAHLSLQNLQASESLVGSWPGAARHSSTTDAALPFFQGRPIRTGSSNLSHVAHGVQRTSSFTGNPASARASMGGLGPDSSFNGTEQLFGSCNSAPITPRSPTFSFHEEDAAMALPNVSAGPAHISRHGPSKLRMSSSDAGAPPQVLNLPSSSAALAASGLQGMNGLDAFTGAFPGCAAPDLQMVLQQQAAMLAQQPNLMTPGAPLPHQAQAAAMAQTAALMANMSQDPTTAAAGLSAYNPMLGGMLPDASASVGNMQMQMLMYYAQLGMMAQMNGGNNNIGMGMQPAGGMPNMANPVMFPMMTPQQMAASFAAAQQQWQAGMPASAIANIAAAAAVAATAASNPEEAGPGSRNSSRPRGAVMDRGLQHRLRCDKGGRGSMGRLDDAMGSPTVQRMDPLLEEYKNNRTRRWDMRDILGHMLEFSLDQLGSRFIQQKLDTLTPEELEAAFAEVAPKGVMLMNDVFGNYVIQKFLELDADGPRQELAQQMKGQVLSLSLQLYSCRVIQKALEVLPLDQKIGMVAELDGALMRCVRDQNGNHVIQKVIECVPTEHITNLLDTFSGSLVSLSQHPFGCRVMQRILEHCTDQQRYNNFMSEILKATVQLAQDQYGNYVIQHVVEQGKPHERDAVYDRLFPHIVVLSQNKFASNVVEKMLLHCSQQQRSAIVEEFLRQPSRRSSSDGMVMAAMTGDEALRVCEQSALEQMMQDQYGNYVVQKTLEVCDEGQRERLLSRVRCYYEILKTSQFGKHIVNRLEKLLSAGMRIQVNSLNNSSPVPPANVSVSTTPGASALQQQPASAAAPAESAADCAAAAVVEDLQYGS